MPKYLVVKLPISNSRETLIEFDEEAYAEKHNISLHQEQINLHPEGLTILYAINPPFGPIAIN